MNLKRTLTCITIILAFAGPATAHVRVASKPVTTVVGGVPAYVPTKVKPVRTVTGGKIPVAAAPKDTVEMP